MSDEPATSAQSNPFSAERVPVAEVRVSMARVIIAVSYTHLTLPTKRIV